MKVREKSKEMLSEINIIPLVDVMLVLLIIFMITAPMLQQGINLDLPTLKSKPLPMREKPEVIHITKSGEIILNEKRVKLTDLKPALELIFASRKEKEIFLKADKDVPYGFVVKCMGEIRQAGIEKINIVTKPEGE